MTNAIPQGFTTITPSLVVSDAKKAIALYKSAFGAKEEGVMLCPVTGKVMHACLTIGNSKIFLSDQFPEMCAEVTNSGFYLYWDDVDGAFAKAQKAGMKELYPLKDEFWGDRLGTITDPFGIKWTMASHVRDVSDEEMQKAGKEWAEKMKNKAA